MRLAFRVIGLALLVAGVALSCYAVYGLLEIGTCASGGPFQSARECPAGTGAKAGLLSLGIPLAIIGMVLSLSFLAGWSALFLGLGGTMGFAALNGTVDGPGRGGIVTVAIVFVVMGIIPLPLLFGMRGLRRRGSGIAATWTPMASFASALRQHPQQQQTLADKIEALHDLHEKGALTEIEFEVAKRRLLEREG